MMNSGIPSIFRSPAMTPATQRDLFGPVEAPPVARAGLFADIVFDRRTLLQWLFDPLYAVGQRG